jgi:hypothetical protein
VLYQCLKSLSGLNNCSAPLQCFCGFFKEFGLIYGFVCSSVNAWSYACSISQIFLSSSALEKMYVRAFFAGSVLWLKKLYVPVTRKVSLTDETK